MHFIDIAEFCDMIMDKQKLENLNEDECYCLLSAALFAHIGFGLNQEIMNRYVDKLGIQKQAEELALAVGGTDKQLTEGYSNLSKATTKKLMDF